MNDGQDTNYKHDADDFKSKRALIEGYCDLFAIYVKTKYPDKDVKIQSATSWGNHHTFLKYGNKYYDGFNTDGVDKVEDLKYFKEEKKQPNGLKIDDYDMSRAPHNPPKK